MLEFLLSLVVNEEAQHTQGNQGTQDIQEIQGNQHFKTSDRKLPHQVDNSKLEIPVLNVLGMNSMGVLSPRESWGLNSL